MSGVKNNLIERKLNSDIKQMNIYYTEEITEYIKDCEDRSNFQCWAEKIVKAKDIFNCSKICIPLAYESIINTIDHSIPNCKDPIEKDEYCMLGTTGSIVTMSLQSKCSKQCKNKGFLQRMHYLIVIG